MKKSSLKLLGLLLVGVLFFNSCMKPAAEELKLEDTVATDYQAEAAVFHLSLPAHLANASPEEVQAYLDALSPEDLERLQEMKGDNRIPIDCTEKLGSYCAYPEGIMIVYRCQSIWSGTCNIWHIRRNRSCVLSPLDPPQPSFPPPGPC